MKVVLQRVLEASVTVNNEKVADIQQGLLILLGIEDADTEEDIKWLTSKIGNLRIFNDAEGVMNISIKDMQGDVIV